MFSFRRADLTYCKKMFLAAKIFREKADDRLPEMGFF
jgi:hypothetical protein